MKVKFKLIENIQLSEASKSSICNDIRNRLSRCPSVTVKVDASNSYVIVATRRNTYALPIEELSRVAHKDYYAVRYKGNGTAVNGELIDSNNNVLGPAYYGKPYQHTHRDFDDEPLVYELTSSCIINPNENRPVVNTQGANAVTTTLDGFIDDVLNDRK